VRSKVKTQPRDALRIGQLAAQSGVPSTALRYYEKAGLLPTPRRTSSGYRAYDASVLPRLSFIRAAQALGLSLAEIRDVIGIRERGTAPCRHVVDLIERHRTDLNRRIRELQRLERELAQLAGRGARLNPAECDPAGICKVIPTNPALDPTLRSTGAGRTSRVPTRRRRGALTATAT
jgi:DNA-binding transcriptional MerR regulator